MKRHSFIKQSNLHKENGKISEQYLLKEIYTESSKSTVFAPPGNRTMY